MSRPAYLVLLVLFIIAACDGQNPVAPRDPGAIHSRKALPDTSLSLSSAAIELLLDRYFYQSEGHALHYAVEREGTAASVHASGERGEHLRVQPEHPGQTQVLVTVTDSVGNRVDHDLLVDVRDDCPRQPVEGEANYFPLEVGQTRTFAYSWRRVSQSPSSRSGVLTWRVVSAGPCAQGEQSFVIEERLVYDASGEPDKVRTLTFEVNDSLVYPGPYFAGGLPRFQAAEAPDTLEFYSKQPRTIYGGQEGWRARLLLVRGEGLVLRSFFDHQGVSYDIYEDLYVKED